MCNLSLGLIEEGREEGLGTGELRGEAKSVVRFAKKHNCTFEEAFDEMGFSWEEQNSISPYLADAAKLI